MKEISLNWIFTIFYGNLEFSSSSRSYNSQKEAEKEAETRISKLLSLDKKNGNRFTREMFSFNVSLEDFNL